MGGLVPSIDGCTIIPGLATRLPDDGLICTDDDGIISGFNGCLGVRVEMTCKQDCDLSKDSVSLD